jgi:HOOK domain
MGIAETTHDSTPLINFSIAYYHHSIFNRTVPNIAAKTSDPDNLLELLELIVGAAVMCERKATFIQAIFRLDHISQTVLKGIVEHAIDRMKAYPSEGEATGVAAAEHPPVQDLDPSEELIRAREMVRHLQEERNRLLGIVGELQAGHSALQVETTALQAQKEQIEKEKAMSGGERDSEEALAVAARNRTLQVRHLLHRKESLYINMSCVIHASLGIVYFAYFQD